jgi:hypothetical protein
VSAAAAQSSPSEPAVSIPAMELAVLLRGRILESNPKTKEITEEQLCKWGREADLMIRRDHRTPEEIVDIIQWSQRDHFWKTNILSMGALREKFDQLTLKRNAEKDASEPAWKRREREAEKRQVEAVHSIFELAKKVGR